MQRDQELWTSTGPQPFANRHGPRPGNIQVRERFSGKRFGIYSAIAISIAFLLILHYLTTPDKHTWHNIYTELHYIPLLIAAVAFGTRGALVTYATILLLYLPVLFSGTAGSPVELLNKVIHLSFSGVFSTLIGYLVQRERHTRKQAEEAKYLAGVGQAAASIVHDLKNPLIVASGFAQRIQAGKGNPGSNIQPVIESLSDMQRIVSDVLDVTRKPVPDLREQDLNKMVEAACGCCNPKAKDKGVELWVNALPEPTMLAMDHAMMKRSLINLIDNAVDASASGQTVTVSIVRCKNSSSVTIQDYGPGIDSETMAHLFTPFHSNKTSGTGLGMAISRKFIEAQAGQIRVDSRMNIGTTITVTFAQQK